VNPRCGYLLRVSPKPRRIHSATFRAASSHSLAGTLVATHKATSRATFGPNET
jgi:hypothetical protein